MICETNWQYRLYCRLLAKDKHPMYISMFYSGNNHLLIQCGVVPCLFVVSACIGMFWHVFILSWRMMDHISNISCVHVLWSLHMRDAPLFMWCECWMLWLLQNLSEKDYRLLKNELCWFDIRYVDDLGFIDPYMLSSVHLI